MPERKHNRGKGSSNSKRKHTRKRINRKYRDTLFAALFGSLENKDAIIDLYNALNRSNYSHDTKLEIVTIRNTVYLGMHNDSAFIIENDILSLWEEQTTYNPNMPLRGLIYLVEEYKRLFADDRNDIYGPVRIKLPTPKYVVFYIGKENELNEIMRLSDSFADPKGGCAEMIATVINICNPENKNILASCHLLWEYTTLNQIIQRNKDSGMTNEEAVEAAIQECIDKGILKKYLLENREEVTDMVLTEYNEKQHYKNVANYYEAEGNLQMLYKLVADDDFSVSKAVERAKPFGVKDEQDFRNRAKLAGYDLSGIKD